MTFSPGPFLTCMIATLFLILYLHVLTRRNVTLSNGMITFTLIGIVVILVRMLVPANFPFTYTIYSYQVLPKLFRPINISIDGNSGSGLVVMHILLVIWFAVAIVLLVNLAVSYYRQRQYFTAFYVDNDAKWMHLHQFIQDCFGKTVRIAVIPKPISPAITGLLTPTLILPEIGNFTDEELEYICLHEAAHYKQHHLWLTLLVEVVCRIHWWNPLVQQMKKEYSLFLELSNDFSLIHSVPKFNALDYASLIVKTAKMVQTPKQINPCGLMTFSMSRPSTATTRVSHILNYGEETRQTLKIRSALCYTLISIAVLLSVFVVPEASYEKLEPSLKDGVAYLTEENAYIIEDESRYLIYVEGEFFGTVDIIPDDLQNIPLYKKGESPYED